MAQQLALRRGCCCCCCHWGTCLFEATSCRTARRCTYTRTHRCVPPLTLPRSHHDRVCFLPYTHRPPAAHVWSVQCTQGPCRYAAPPIYPPPTPSTHRALTTVRQSCSMIFFRSLEHTTSWGSQSQHAFTACPEQNTGYAQGEGSVTFVCISTRAVCHKGSTPKVQPKDDGIITRVRKEDLGSMCHDYCKLLGVLGKVLSTWMMIWVYDGHDARGPSLPPSCLPLVHDARSCRFSFGL